MKIHLRHAWEVVSSGYWFVPTIMTTFAAFGAFFFLFIDTHYLTSTTPVGWLYSGGSDGAKTLLSTVAGSVITVAGVVFSITIAALTQASAQFGPRLLRNFMRDRGNQSVLGTFVATFLYCILVLRTIHGKLEDGLAFVPQASVTVAVLLAIASMAVLIYFIHHVSISLQAPNVVAAVRWDLVNVINHLAAAHKARGIGPPGSAHDKPLPADFETASASVASTGEGYIQALDYDALLHLATEKELIFHLRCRPGDYIMAGHTLLRVWPAQRWDPGLAGQVNEAVICGSHGTSEQDLEYAIHQMVEIAIRALSPGINDPFTAINCIDALASVVCRLAHGGLITASRVDAAGALRLVAPVSTFAGITDAAFNQIRQYGRGSVAVTLRLLEAIAHCTRLIEREDQRRELLRHAEMVYRQSQSEAAMPEEHDRQEAHRRWEAVMRAMGEPPDNASVGH